MFEGPTRPMTTRVTTTFLVAVLAATWLAVSAAPASATYVRATTSETSFASMINADRRAHGLRPLRVVSALTRVARAWSGAMANDGDISHNPRLTKQIGSWRAIGENVGVGADIRQLHLALMASPSHRANLLSRTYTEVGIGVVRRNGRLYVTEDFRRPSVSTSSAVASPSIVTVDAPAVAVAPAPTSVAGPTPVAVDDGLAAEFARLAALEPPADPDPVSSAIDFVTTMRILTS
ncbi:MAG: SCP-like extracellular [Frankiales bacterium]|nr:SCP-like extracellular [Frankiales bacterium]